MSLDYKPISDEGIIGVFHDFCVRVINCPSVSLPLSQMFSVFYHASSHNSVPETCLYMKRFKAMQLSKQNKICSSRNSPLTRNQYSNISCLVLMSEMT